METLIEIVKKKLWSFGYKVKDVSKMQTLDYDLIVNEKYLIRVIPKAKKTEVIDGITNVIVDDDTITYQVCDAGTCIDWTSPLKAFPKD